MEIHDEQGLAQRRGRGQLLLQPGCGGVVQLAGHRDDDAASGRRSDDLEVSAAPRRLHPSSTVALPLYYTTISSLFGHPI